MLKLVIQGKQSIFFITIYLFSKEYVKGTVMQIEKALINDRLRNSKVS